MRLSPIVLALLPLVASVSIQMTRRRIPGPHPLSRRYVLPTSHPRIPIKRMVPGSSTINSATPTAVTAPKSQSSGSHASDTTSTMYSTVVLTTTVTVPGAASSPAPAIANEAPSILTSYVTVATTIIVPPEASVPAVTSPGGVTPAAGNNEPSTSTSYVTVATTIVVSPGEGSLVAAEQSSKTFPGGATLGQGSSSSAGTASGVISDVTFAAASTSGAKAVATAIPLRPADPWVYTIDVQIGPDGTTVPLLVDTGSYSLWAADASCGSCKAGGMTLALQADNSTCQHYETAYSTGHFSGCVVNTTMSFGPYKLDSISMAAATEIGDVLASHGSSFSGMFGLAMHAGRETDTPIARMRQLGLIADPWVGLRLRREGEGESEMVLGNALNSTFGDPSHHVSVPQASGAGQKYNITLDNIKIFKGQYVVKNTTGVLLDSGTSNIVVPQSHYEDILAALGAVDVAGAYEDGSTHAILFNCTRAAPDETALTFTFGGKDFGVQWRDVIASPVVIDGSSDYCGLRIQSIGTEDWILGESFLVNVYHAINTETGAVQLWKPAG